MTGEEFNIISNPTICISTCSMPLFCIYHNKLKAQLELLQQQEITALIMEATEWCFPMVITSLKTSASAWIFCTLTDMLNWYAHTILVIHIPQPHIPYSKAITDITVANAKFFTVLPYIDTMKGYYQCSLDQNSQLLTTFITPLAGSSCSMTI